MGVRNLHDLLGHRLGRRESTVPLMQNRLRVLRAEHNLTQAELAERVNVTRQTIIAIESGKYDPSLPLAFSIARTFNQAIEDIFLPEL